LRRQIDPWPARRLHCHMIRIRTGPG